jgi:predicted unusual protein kinase regulating ubiquinone biosynthesis (AarF/ABC1/UbiB family)
MTEDPHPGNFMVTPEGKLVILDYGLMTEVSIALYTAMLTALHSTVQQSYCTQYMLMQLLIRHW